MELKWHEAGSRLYETGISNGALYIQKSDGTYDKGVAWNGLMSVIGSPSGGEPSPIYANNVKIGDTISVTDFGGRIEAFTYPDIFAECDGVGLGTGRVLIAMQKRKRFALVYKTILGNDTNEMEHGYKLHVHYGCRIQPSPVGYTTMSENVDLLHYSWTFTSLPVRSLRLPPLTYLCLNSSLIESTKMAAINDILFGTELTDARLALPDEFMNILSPLSE